MAFITLLTLAVLIYLVLHFGQRIHGSWMGSRVLARVLDRPSDAPRARLDPESQFVIRMTDSTVSCHRPDGIVETVRWDDLQRIDILTNSDGPFAPDCFWLLHGSETGCCIPQGATGDAELLARLQQFPGFNNQIFIEGMGSTQEAISGLHEHSPNHKPAKSSFTHFL